jgi:DeoR/GlpR family transcriptional regulator of sugar metabolism
MRRRAIAERLRVQGGGSVAELELEFDVSAMTIRRDLSELERHGLAKRTHGGAVAPGLAAYEDSFSQRLNQEVDAKQRLAVVAASLIEPGEVVFLDSSSSAYYVARQIVANATPVSIVTNSLPVMQLCASTDANIDLTGVGGSFRKLTLSMVGPVAARTIREHFADKVFVSVKGVAGDGSLTDPDPHESEVKRAMIERAEESILLLQAGKLQARGSHWIANFKEVSLVLATDLSQDQLSHLRSFGVAVRSVD